MTAPVSALDRAELVALDGERGLWHAVVQMAVRDSLGVGPANGLPWERWVRRRREIREEARRWFRGGPSGLPFEAIAAALGFDAPRALARLEDLWARWDRAPLSRRRPGRYVLPDLFGAEFTETLDARDRPRVDAPAESGGGRQQNSEDIASRDGNRAKSPEGVGR